MDASSLFPPTAPAMDAPIADAAAAPEQPTDYESTPNLAESLPADFLKRVGELVVNMKKLDWDSSSEYRQKRQRHLELFSGKVPERSSNEKNILYVHLPYLTKAVLLFHSKMHRNFFPATGDICGVKIYRPSEMQRERKLSRHLNLYLTKRVPEYVPAHDRGGMQMLIYGSTFSVWYWDPIEERACFEFCGSDDIIVPYAHRSDRIDLADLPRVTWRKTRYRHELEQYAAKKYFVNVDKIFTKPYGPDGAPQEGSVPPGEGSNESKGGVQKAADELMGVHQSTEDNDRPRHILEQDRWLALPGETFQRPVRVTVDEDTKIVHRLELRVRERAKDQSAYKRSVMAHEEQVASMQVAHEEATNQYGAALDQHAEDSNMAASQGFPPPPHPGEPPMPPEMPQPPEKPAKTVPFNRYSHYGCIPNPEGFYCYGLGYLIEGHNITANEVMSLYVSLMRMNLRPTGWFSRQMKTPRGEFEMVLGELKESHLPPGQLDKGIWTFQFPPPDPNAFKVEERQAQAVQEITADDIIGGAAGMSGQTAAETEIRSSNAMDNISMIATRYNRARSNEITVLAYILSQALPDEGDSFFVKNDQPPAPGQPPNSGEYEEFVVTREDYQDDFEIVFTADPNLASQPQRERTAMKMFQTAQQVLAAPIPVLDPQTSVMLLRATAAEVFKAMEHPEYAQIIQNAMPPQPPQPQGPPGPGGPGGPPPQGDGQHADPNGAGAPPVPPEQNGPGNQGAPVGIA